MHDTSPLQTDPVLAFASSSSFLNKFHLPDLALAVELGVWVRWLSLAAGAGLGQSRITLSSSGPRHSGQTLMCITAAWSHVGGATLLVALAVL